jgi:hypothetical protein
MRMCAPTLYVTRLLDRYYDCCQFLLWLIRRRFTPVRKEFHREIAPNTSIHLLSYGGGTLVAFGSNRGNQEPRIMSLLVQVNDDRFRCILVVQQ